jgi:hypothetical protein
MILGRSWCASWVCGEGRVDQQDSTTSLGDESCRGCYLGIPHERYLWRVHVTGRGPRVECLCGMKPQDWGCYFSTGRRMSRRVGHWLAPREDVLFGPTKDWYALGTQS